MTTTRTISEAAIVPNRADGIVSQRDGIPFKAARERLMVEVETAPLPAGRRREALYLDRALELFREHPGLLLWTQVRWLPELMLGTGAAGLSARLGLQPEPGRSAVPALALSALAGAHLPALTSWPGWRRACLRHATIPSATQACWQRPASGGRASHPAPSQTASPGRSAGPATGRGLNSWPAPSAWTPWPVPHARDG